MNKNARAWNTSMNVAFSNLITAYPTWEVLKPYLLSGEGGRLRIVPYTGTTGPYALIRYVKGQSDLSRPHVAALRSAVWNTETNRPVGLLPVKSVTGDSFPRTGDLSLPGYKLEEFIDGTAILMWYNPHATKWEICTRSTPGAIHGFYSRDLSFAQMFAEASQGLDTSILDTASSYTFVLQHPRNRIVLPVERPAIRCVQRVQIQPDNTLVYAEIPSALHPPRPYAFTSLVDLLSALYDPRNRTQGIVIKSSDTRWKHRTAFYNRAHRLRGNKSDLNEVYLTLWKEKTLDEYLATFREERRDAKNTLERFKQLTRQVYAVYNDAFKAKTLPRTAIPVSLRCFVYGLHNLYIQQLRPAQRTVDWQTAQEFMNGFEDMSRVMYAFHEAMQGARNRIGMATVPTELPAVVGTEVVVTDAPEVVREEDVPASVPEPV